MLSDKTNLNLPSGNAGLRLTTAKATAPVNEDHQNSDLRLDKFVSDDLAREVLMEKLAGAPSLNLKGPSKRLPLEAKAIYKAIHDRGTALRASRGVFERSFRGVEVDVPSNVGEIADTLGDLSNLSAKELFPNEYGLSLYVGESGQLRAVVQRGGSRRKPDVKPERFLQFPDGERASYLGLLGHSHLDGPPIPSQGDRDSLRLLRQSRFTDLIFSVLAVPSPSGVALFSLINERGVVPVKSDIVRELSLEAMFSSAYDKEDPQDSVEA